MGELTSVASLPQTNGTHKTIALGYVRREIGKPGNVLQAGAASATVSELPFAL